MFNGLRIFGALGEMSMRWGLQPSGFGRRKEKRGREEGEEIPLPASKSRNRLYFALLFYAAGDCCISAVLLCLRGKAVVYIYSKIYYVQALF